MTLDIMLERKTLTGFKNLFSPLNFEKNDEVIRNYFFKKYKPEWTACV